MFLVVVGGQTVIVANLPRHILPEGVETALVVVWIALVAVATGWLAWKLHKWATTVVNMPSRVLAAIGGAISGAVDAASDGWKAVRNAASSMMGWR
jgi:hypothetical protein